MRALYLDNQPKQGKMSMLLASQSSLGNRGIFYCIIEPSGHLQSLTKVPLNSLRWIDNDVRHVAALIGRLVPGRPALIIDHAVDDQGGA